MKMGYVKKKIGRRRTFLQKYKIPLLLLACAAGFLFFWVNRAPRPPVPAGYYVPETSSWAPEWVAQSRIPVRDNERVVYAYSVIPGGVRNREELAANMSKDRVVAEHFADFSVGQARMINSEVPQEVHVSYRIRDKVFWTSKTIRIPKGESLITDGRSFARSRCGNRISVEPQAPVSEEEPEPESFDIPVLARAEPGELTAPPPVSLEFREVTPITPILPYYPAPPPKILPYYYRPLFAMRPTPEFVIPEPSGLSLLLTGLIALCAFCFSRYFRKK